MTPFEALFRSIVYQQLSGRAAANILSRLLGMYGESFPAPEQVENTPGDQLRECGLSWSKVRSVRDLANKTILGLVPADDDISSMNDRELIKAFTKVYGIGPWTVEMLMIFNLGRPDVLPVSDLGIRRGFKVAYGRDELPDANELSRGRVLLETLSNCSQLVSLAGSGSPISDQRMKKITPLLAPSACSEQESWQVGSEGVRPTQS